MDLLKEIEIVTEQPIKALEQLFHPFLERLCEKCVVKTGSCCCNGCERANGYLLRAEDNHKGHSLSRVRRVAYLELLKKKYPFYKKGETKDGFYDSKTGCVLPRYLRSDTCLRHTCMNMKPFENTIPITYKGVTISIRLHDFAVHLAREIEHKRQSVIRKYFKGVKL